MAEADAKPVNTAIKLTRDIIAGGVGGMCLVLVGHPLDTIKVRLQTSTQYKGVVDCFTSTLRNEGFRGLYRGMLPPLVGITPIYSLCFFGYGVGKSMVAKPGEQLSLFQFGVAGAISAVFTTVIMAPGERVKTLLQTQDPKNPKYKGMGDCFKQVYRQGGIASVYKGSVATLLRDAPASFMYFSTYEYLKRVLSDDSGKLNPGAVLFAGGFAGIMNWLVAIPPDVLKSRLQAAPEGKYRGIRDVFTELMAKEGPAALYKGVAPVMLRAFPANAATFLGVEFTYKLLDKIGFTA